MKKFVVFLAIFAVALLTACGGEEAADNTNGSDSADSATVSNTGPVSYEEIVANYGEEKVKEMYIDIQAHAEASFLSGGILGDISTAELMEMSAEERQEYAIEQGKKKGREVAKRIGEAVEANQITMREWRAISSHANENDWRDQMMEQLQARKNELKAQMEAEGNAEGEEQ